MDEPTGPGYMHQRPSSKKNDLTESRWRIDKKIMIQVHAVMFVTSSQVAVCSFCFSLAMSLNSVAGAFDLIELDLWPIFQ